MNSASPNVRRMLLVAAAMAVATSLATTAMATTYNWVGPSGDDWSNANDWAVGAVTGTVPTATDTVSFNSLPAVVTPSVLVAAPQSITTINFDTGAANFTIGSIGDGGLTFQNNGNINVNSGVASGRTETIASSIIAGTGSVATILHFNNNSGNSPTFNLGAAGTTSTIQAGTTGGAIVTLQLDGNSGAATNTINDQIIDGASGGAVGITRNGSTTRWILTNATSAYSGPTSINSGSAGTAATLLQYSNTGALYNPTSAVTVQNGGVLGVNVGGAGEFTNITDNTTAGSLSNLMYGSTGKAITWSTGSIIAVDTTNAGGTFTYSAPITDHAGNTFGFAKLGAGTFIIPASVTNTYTGFTTFGAAGINNGTLQIDGSNNTVGQTVIPGNQAQNPATTTTLVLNNAGVGLNGGLASGLITMSGGILSTGPNLSGGLTLANNISFTQNGTFAGANSITVNGSLTMQSFRSVYNVIPSPATLTLAGNVNVGPNAGSAAGIGFQGTGNTIVTGLIQSEPGGTAGANGTVAAQMTGSATVTFSHANIYTGTTNIATGILIMNNASNGGLGTVGTVQFGGGTLQSALPNQVLTNNNSIVTGTSTVSGSNAITINGTFTNSGGNRTLNSSITGGNLLTLAGNVYLSEATATGRTFTLGGTGNTVISQPIANFNGVGTAGNFTVTNTGTTVISGANTYSGTTTVNNGAGTLRIDGTNSSAGGTTLTGGTAVMNNATNGGVASGLLTFNGGTLQSLADRTLSNNATMTAANSTVSGAFGVTINGTVTNTGGTAGSRGITSSISDLSKKLTLVGDVSIAEDTGTTARTFTLAGTGNTMFNGVVKNVPASGTAVGSVAITNTGRTVFAGGNTYTGTTTISGGAKVLVNGTTVGQGNYAITSSATTNTTLAGTGTINLAALATFLATGTDATHAAIVRNGPMDGVNDGYLTIQNTAAATLATFAQATVDILPTPSGGATPYYLTFAGPLTFGDVNTTLNINDLGGPLTQPQYNLISSSTWSGGTAPFGFANITYNGAATTFDNVGGTGYQLVTDGSHFTLAVPEPASLALLGLAGLMLLPRRRRAV